VSETTFGHISFDDA